MVIEANRNYIVATGPLNLEQKVIGTYFDGKIRNHGNLMLTINRWNSIPSLVRSQDYSRIAERLSHAAAPTHRDQPVSIFIPLVHGYRASVEL